MTSDYRGPFQFDLCDPLGQWQDIHPFAPGQRLIVSRRQAAQRGGGGGQHLPRQRGGESERPGLRSAVCLKVDRDP